jgi:23S rRNA maturation mini-RNase III
MVIIIPNDFCHPYEHKISSIDYIVNSVHRYPIAKAKEKELSIIKDTLHNKEYNIKLNTRHSNQHKHNKNTDPQYQKTKWATFTYNGKETENHKTL